MSLRLAFMGTPEFSVPVLEALHQAGHEIVAVYSQPPRPAGRRGLELTPTPVASAAEKLGIEVLTPKSLKDRQEQERFSSFKLDAAIVVAYGLLLPKAILGAPRFGCFNGHASLLPRWRGAAPIQRAIMAGDKKTGMMIMKMDEGLDTGPIALSKSIDIAPDMTAGELYDKLEKIAAPLMVKAMEKLEQGDLTLTPQKSEGETYAKKITKDETRIDWSKPAKELQKRICGLSPFPGSWCEMEISGKRERVKLLKATLVAGSSLGAGHIDPKTLTIHCGKGCLQITRLQKAGGKAMDAETFLHGFHVTKVY
ncbi:methionyl-tRNA formyltransferase [Bartonella apis]|uniref:Methionyl-tRNA formyltransferase n=1 Tax=Bartonella apis TaxID=1686310 RepID=A0A1R0FC73_9HYPH|nr:methionyl-tRNA formyltransferase [Bartonella apis]MCT6824049.1 methionyl-tRNA formyltransferase [Bartonella apis]OLY44512.1 methionyl-tRNA formyltransferase [Bartonella apis]